MATGDLKNNLRKLQTELKLIKYDQDVDIESLGQGVTSSYLPIYHYVFMDFSRHVAEKILELQMEMYCKTDLRFIETMFKVLRVLFAYKPPLTKDQFCSAGFSERKIIMCTEIIQLVREKHKNLNKSTTKNVVRMNRSMTSAIDSLTSSQVVSDHAADNGHTSFNSISDITVKKEPKLVHKRSSVGPSKPCGISPLVVKETRHLLNVANPVLEHEAREPVIRTFEAIHKDPGIKRSEVMKQVDSTDFDSRPNESEISAGRLKLTETSVSQLTLLMNSICQSMSHLVTRIDQIENRLHSLESSTLLSEAPRSPARSPADQRSDPVGMIDNLTARMILAENKLMLLEKQGKNQKIFPSIDAENDQITESLYVTDIAPSPPREQFNPRLASFNSSYKYRDVPSLEPVDRMQYSDAPSSLSFSHSHYDDAPTSLDTSHVPATEQTARIEAMLRETEELLRCNSSQDKSPGQTSNASVDLRRAA